MKAAPPTNINSGVQKWFISLRSRGVVESYSDYETRSLFNPGA